MKKAKYRVAATATAMLAVAVLFCWYYYTHDPSAGGAPRCLFRFLTGYDCPGCGSQRALHALLHGRPADAWGYNPFVFFAVPAAAFYIIVENGRALWPRFHARAVHPAILCTVLAVLLAWWVLRNVL